ncbi:unnamed protein product [Rotaria sp. Silwood2]|nr:unnamed protein product [Rotaria sp. Silwood2]
MSEVDKNKLKRFLVEQALLKDKSSLLSRIIFRKVKQIFGGEVTAMLSASAPISHYHDDETKTRETIDEASWSHTDDVGEWTVNGTLQLIDCSKHIFKLNQGEYIAPEHLEDVYLHSRWISQIFIDGCSTEATVVAIVVPNEEYVRKNFTSTGTKE